MKLIYTIKNDDKCSTINEVLKNKLKISKRLLKILIDNKLIYLNDSLCDTRENVNNDDKILIDLSYPEDNSNIIATKMNLNIIYEDNWLLIVNKPKGIAIHPSILHYEDSLSNGIKFYFDKIGLRKKIRPVNRLDFNTSGLVIFAKCSYIHECLSNQMKNGTFSKSYLALVHGKFKNSKSTINLPIGRNENSIIERKVDFENGQKAITKYLVIKYFEKSDQSLVKCDLITGRTHQIRVHFSYIGHPLVGDSLYGNKNDNIDGQMLHCYLLKYKHPINFN